MKSTTHTINYQKFVALEYPKTMLWKALNTIIITMIIISIIVQIVWSLGMVWQIFASQIFTINLIIVSVLALDWFYRYLCSADQLWFILNFFSIIELLSFLPFFVQMLLTGYVGYEVHILSAIWKLFIIIRLLRYFKILNHLYNAIKINRYKYEIALVLLTSLWVISWLMIHYIESWVNHKFDSIPSALWRSIVTMSTVWYGDLVPQTSMGKLMGWLVIFFWPVFLGIISSITVVTFLDMLKYHHKYQELTKCTKCFNTCNDADAFYCKMCGDRIISQIQNVTKHKIKDIDTPEVKHAS